MYSESALANSAVGAEISFRATLIGGLCAGLQGAVDRMLVAQPPNASAEARQQHLKLLMEVYKRTHALAEQLQVPCWPPLCLPGLPLLPAPCSTP